MIPFGVYHDPLAQSDFGIAGIDDSEVVLSGLALITFGFLFGQIWANCDDDETTSWTDETDETTSWSDAADVSTSWSELVYD